MDLIYLDFAKAFDRVDHSLLLTKLATFSLPPLTINWLKTYLAGRTYRVRAQGVLSTPITATSGVPQGSILGPLLFILFLNDITSSISSHIAIDTDDIKLWNNAESSDLATDLAKVEAWSVANNLRLNDRKCKVMHLRHNTATEYFLYGNKLDTSLLERDLETFVYSDLKLTANCTRMASKASKMAGLLHRTLGPLQPNNFRTLHLTYIRPLLEVNIQACSPFLAKDCNILERTQRRATKRVIGLRNRPYGERLDTLNLFTLDFRRY